MLIYHLSSCVTFGLVMCVNSKLFVGDKEPRTRFGGRGLRDEVGLVRAYQMAGREESIKEQGEPLRAHWPLRVSISKPVCTA